MPELQKWTWQDPDWAEVKGMGCWYSGVASYSFLTRLIGETEANLVPLKLSASIKTQAISFKKTTTA